MRWGQGQCEIQGGEEGLARLRAAGGKVRGRQQPGQRRRLSEGWAGMGPPSGRSTALDNRLALWAHLAWCPGPHWQHLCLLTGGTL